MRLVLLAIQMLVLILPAIAEDPLTRYVDGRSAQRLRAGRQVTANVAEGGALVLVPAVASREEIQADISALHPTVGVEVLKVISGGAAAMDSPDQWLRVYNVLHSVSTMKGIPYYSISRKKDHVLFTESYAISSVDDRRRIADPVFGSIPADDILLTFQEDSSFGKNTYQESFRFRADHLVVKIENLSTVSFLFVPLMSPRNLVSEIVLVPLGPDVLFYGLAYLRSSVPIGDHRSKVDSLTNRMNAVARWLKARLESGGAP